MGLQTHLTKETKPSIVVLVQPVKVCGGVEVQFHSFLTWTLHDGSPREQRLRNPYNMQLGAFEKEEVSCLYGESNRDSLVVQPDA